MTEPEMPGMADTQSLAHFIGFFMSFKQSTFFTSIKNQGLRPEGHAYQFSHYECDECYHTSSPSSWKLWILHCRRSSSYRKYFPFLPNSTSQLTVGPGSRVASRGPHHQHPQLPSTPCSKGHRACGTSAKWQWRP